MNKLQTGSGLHVTHRLPFCWGRCLKSGGRFFALLFLLTSSLSAHAATVTATTGPVMGRAPTGTVTVTGSNPTPVVGDTLNVKTTFHDDDDDKDFGSTIAWYRDDVAVGGATGEYYTLQAEDAGATITVGYTPKTNEADTDPAVGKEVKSGATAAIIGLPDGTLSVFSVSPASGTIVAGKETARLTLTLVDASKKPVTGIAGRLSLAGGAAADITLKAMGEQSAGVYDFTVTGDNPGSVTLSPQADGHDLNTIPDEQTITLTGGSNTTMEFFSPGTPVEADGVTPRVVKVIVRDGAARPVQGVTVTFSTTLPAKITGPDSGITNSDGEVTISVVSTGTDKNKNIVTASVSGSADATLKVDFNAGAPDTDKSSLTVNDGATPVSIVAGTGGAATLRLTLRDKYNNAVTGKTVTFPAYPVAGGGAVVDGITDIDGWALTAKEIPKDSGVYIAPLKGKTSGTVRVSTTVGGSAFTAAPSNVTVILTPDLLTAHVTQVGLYTTGKALADGKSRHLRGAIVVDKNYNYVPAGVTVNWSTDSSTAILSADTSDTNSSGVAMVEVRDTVAETVSVTAKVSANAADKGQSADTIFRPYPIVSSVSNTGPALNNQPADNKSPNTLIVQVVDLANQPVVSNSTDVKLDFTGSVLLSSMLKYGTTDITDKTTDLLVSTDNDGRVTLMVTDTTPETIIVKVKTSGGKEAAITQTSTFGVYPVLKKLAVSTVPGESGVPADNVSLNKIIATVTDMKGTVLADQPVTLTFSADRSTVTFDKASPWSTTTDADGKVTLGLKDSNTEGGTVVVSAYIQDSATDEQTSTVTFRTSEIPFPAPADVSVNNVSFGIAEGFPTTAFKEATFTIRANGTGSDTNNKYTWSSSSEDWLRNDGNGKYTITGKPTGVAAKIKAVPVAGGNPRIYTVDPKGWFVNDGGSGVSIRTNWSGADLFCKGKGALPTRGQISQAQVISDTGRRASRGGLWSEWGNLTLYTNAGFTGYEYWLSEEYSRNGTYTMYWTARMSSSSLTIQRGDTGLFNTVCRQEL